MIAEPGVNFDLDAYARVRRQLIETKLAALLPVSDPRLLYESMRYSVLSAGKRMRGLLCLAAAEALAHTEQAIALMQQAALPCACAIEMVHAMSLIHDDLPCMDNDDFRRGQPTNHKKYGEAVALLAGDALLIYAVESLLNETPTTVSRDRLVEVVQGLAKASGPQGMVGGQVADCIATGIMADFDDACREESTEQLLESIHKRKTGALLTFSVWSGARLAGADEKVLQALLAYGETLGLAFQIADDLLDLTGDLQTIGKTPGKDQAAGKTTWISVYGVEGARQALRKLESQGKSALIQSGLSERSLAPLSSLLSYAIHRNS
jgi:geranylgeranyl diphosphate synthase type II